MEKFKALFHGTDVYINKRFLFRSNEILTAYLNLEKNRLEEMYQDLKLYRKKLFISPQMPYSKEVTGDDCYDYYVRETQKIMNRIDEYWSKIPPYSAFYFDEERGHALLKCLNKHSIIFENGADLDDEDRLVYPRKNQYGCRMYDEFGEPYFYLTHFAPSYFLDLWSDGETNQQDLTADMNEANEDIEKTVSTYLNWLEDVLRVKYIYETLLEDYIHVQHSFLKGTLLAEQFEAFYKVHSVGLAVQPYRVFGRISSMTTSHEVIYDENGYPVLCRSCEFDRIGDFLYMDFFSGLEQNFIPKRCNNCGKWFLLQGGKYSDYCENPLKDDPSKTCRSTSARKRYADKCKTDPIWLAYNRAYKSRYARYMKKKMTITEFEKWSAKAIELREQAEKRKISLAEYEAKLKE